MPTTRTPHLWKVGVYLRLSKEDARRESASIANQRAILLDYLNHEFQDPWTLTQVYTDDGRTGTDDSRPAFQSLIRDVERGKVNCVLCKTLSRAFRNYADQGYYLEEFFPRHRTRFIALGSPRVDSYLHPDAVQWGLEIPINGILNDRYAAKTSADVRRTLDMKRRRGEFIGSFAPYGYAKDPENKHALVPDPAAAQVVRQVFQWYAQGLGQGGIAQKLNEAHVPNPTAYKTAQGLHYRRPGQAGDGLWSAGSIGRLLKNPVYAGTMVQGRQEVVSYKVHETRAVPEGAWFVVENTHPPLVPPEVFQQVQTRLRQPARRPPGEAVPHLFAGLLRCAGCGGAMSRKTAKGFVYYTCSTHRRKSKTACTPHTIRADRLRLAVAAQLGVSPEDVDRPLLFTKLQEILVEEGGNVRFLPLDGGEASFHLTKI